MINVDGGSTVYDRSPWHATFPVLQSPRPNEFVISVDDRIFNESISREDFSPIILARKAPMVPVQAKGGAYILYSSATPAMYWSGNVEIYSVFSDLARAQAFVRTHRFFMQQN